MVKVVDTIKLKNEELFEILKNAGRLDESVIEGRVSNVKLDIESTFSNQYGITVTVEKKVESNEVKDEESDSIIKALQEKLKISQQQLDLIELTYGDKSFSRDDWKELIFKIKCLKELLEEMNKRDNLHKEKVCEIKCSSGEFSKKVNDKLDELDGVKIKKDTNSKGKDTHIQINFNCNKPNASVLAKELTNIIRERMYKM